MAKIFIGNLPFNTTQDELKEMLQDFKVSKIDMPLDRNTDRFRGFAFAEVENAEQAVKELNGGSFGDREMHVSLAEERKGPRVKWFGVKVEGVIVSVLRNDYVPEPEDFGNQGGEVVEVNVFEKKLDRRDQ